MSDEMIVKQQAESIKLSKMSKGYQWEIRVHIKGDNYEDKIKGDDEVLLRLENLNKELERRYGYKDED